MIGGLNLDSRISRKTQIMPEDVSRREMAACVAVDLQVSRWFIVLFLQTFRNYSCTYKTQANFDILSFLWNTEILFSPPDVTAAPPCYKISMSHTVSFSIDQREQKTWKTKRSLLSNGNFVERFNIFRLYEAEERPWWHWLFQRKRNCHVWWRCWPMKWVSRRASNRRKHVEMFNRL